MQTPILPGEIAQFTMAPASRKAELKTPATNPRESAVMVAFFAKNNKPHLIMIKRAADNSVHSGQISFPGGKSEITDISLKETALRETEEEIGIPEQQIEVIGKLSSLYIPPSNFCVMPYVGLIESEPFFVTNQEVDRLLIIDWECLLRPENTTYKYIKYRSGNIKVPCFLIHGEVIWGASAMILAELVYLLSPHCRLNTSEMLNFG